MISLHGFAKQWLKQQNQFIYRLVLSMSVKIFSMYGLHLDPCCKLELCIYAKEDS